MLNLMPKTPFKIAGTGVTDVQESQGMLKKHLEYKRSILKHSVGSPVGWGSPVHNSRIKIPRIQRKLHARGQAKNQHQMILLHGLGKTFKTIVS